ncbi:MAG: peptide chain release factor 2 [Spirochaetia bacterium]|nr:peptide chain release factor 2 [Spirochaetales bacterium]MDX9784427.1 peptide chain release factor 2 [Spirochaetia bacterium]
MLEELSKPIEELKEEILDIWGRLDAATVEKSIKEKENLSSEPDFWNDSAKAGRIFASIKQAKERLETWKSLTADINNLYEFFSLALDEEQAEMEADIVSNLGSIRERFDKAVVLELLSGEADSSDAYVSIHAGSGGTEACDWAGMLLRMYSRWAERRGFSTEVIDLLEAEGGIKSATLQISGSYAYGYLKGEGGVHRLVRISPFDANARRHTSFASLYVLPVLDDSITIDIRPEDIRIDTYRSGGAGGQKVNKTDSAVRITHLETGIVVTCQNERSQYKNKDVAMSVLKSRLYEHYRQEKEKENEKFQSDKKEIAWGSQIRSYVFQPYTLVKDHRTKFSLGNVQAVMDGDIDPFIESFLRWRWKGGVPTVDSDDEEV